MISGSLTMMTMLRLLTCTVLMSLSVCVLAQNAPQAPAPQAPGANTQAAQPSGRPPIRAKTNDEFQTYQAATANAQNPDAMAKAADDFAAKFPDSELRVLLYRVAMHSYQTAGNSDKMLDMGLKVLAIDKDDPEALIGVAEVQEEHTAPTDLDRDQRMTQSLNNAQHALETIDTDLAVPAGTPPEKVDAYKKYLRSSALSIIGTIQYKREQYADAETNLRKAIDADASNPDPVVILRLALAMDQEKKYQDALQQANRAVQLTQEDTDIGKMARSERDRLVMQTGGNNAPGGNGSPANSAPTTNPSSGNGATGTPTGAGTAAPPANVPPSSAPPSH